MYDKRLIGMWKSDARKTMREIRNRRDIPENQQKKLKSIFGKLKVRYTRTRVYSDFERTKCVGPYRVVAKDADSVAIIARDALDEKRICHINFEGNYYWVCAGKFREFFKRTK